MRLFWNMLLGLAIAGCDTSFEATKTIGETGDATAFATDSDISTTPPDENPSLEDGLEGKLILVEYALNVTAGPFTVCEGTINLRFNPLFTDNAKVFELPSSPVSCALGLAEFDIAQLMGSLSGVDASSGGVSGLQVKDHVVSLDQLFSGQYQPGRPLFPSLIAAPIDELRRVSTTRSVVLTDTTDGTQSKGTIGLDVTSVGQNYTAPGGQQFRDVVTFRVQNRGFDGANLIRHFLFKDMEMGVSLNPISVTSIKMVAHVRDFQGVIGGGSGGISILDSLGIGSGASSGLVSVLVTLAKEYIKTIEVNMDLQLVRVEGLE